MQYIDGFAFGTAQEYEDGLYDKKIIDSVKETCDLTTETGIKKAYSILSDVRFRSKLGDSFDNEVYELYEKVRANSFIPKDEPVIEKKNHVRQKKVIQPVKIADEKTKAEVLKELKRQSFLRTVLVLSLLVVAVGSLGFFVKYYSDALAVEREANALSKLKDDKFAEILKNVVPEKKKEYAEEIVIPDILDEYLALYNKNKSLIGWIKIADTIIDYPVMQTSDNEYYLKHNFDQKNDANGCIFMDCNCDVILGNDNYILYGHHMKSGKMFASLQNYANEDYYNEHKIIEFDTIYEKGTYEVMYAFRSHIYNESEIAFKYYQFIDAASEAEFNSNIEEMEKLSLIDTGVTAVYGDRLLTLSTCDYQEANGRFVVVAKKVD